jgi:hypothetical protein
VELERGRQEIAAGSGKGIGLRQDIHVDVALDYNARRARFVKLHSADIVALWKTAMFFTEDKKTLSIGVECSTKWGE